MNIVKLKDILMTEDCEFKTFFNDRLKGKYAYWVQMRYIFPLDSMDYKTYIQYEQLDPIDFNTEGILQHIDLYCDDCCMSCFSQKYIDCEETENANSIYKYEIANNYVTDNDIDITKLRNFRSWLAAEILKLNTTTDGKYINKLNEHQLHMLEYYKNDMYNDVVKQLSVFGNESQFSLQTNTTSCSCCNTNAIDILNSVNTCNALNIYVSNLHNLMVQTFEDVNFWLDLDSDFIILFKKYIDNIIKVGLTVANNTNDALYLSCNCNKYSNVQESILKNLSDALYYIINSDTKGHLNFIHDALYKWADSLYDKMSWNIK